MHSLLKNLVFRLLCTIFAAVMNNMKNYIGICALAIAVLSCKGKANDTQTEQVNGLYSAVLANSQQAEARQQGKKAQVVRLFEIPAPLKDRPEQILHRRGYTTSYNQTTKTPNWVAWHLTAAHTKGRINREQEVFTEDEDVAKGQRATDNDYYNSRYDRGHMCPAGDNKWDQQAMTQSFLFTNICPQNHGLNKYEWNDLEMLCREWARKYGAVDIVCGPLFTTSGEQKTIGQNKVWVPDAFFKVVLCRQGSPKAIGFVYQNVGKKQAMANAARSVDEIERLTKMDFFPELDDKTETRIEAKAELSDWYIPRKP